MAINPNKQTSDNIFDSRVFAISAEVDRTAAEIRNDLQRLMESAKNKGGQNGIEITCYEFIFTVVIGNEFCRLVTLLSKLNITECVKIENAQRFPVYAEVTVEMIAKISQILLDIVMLAKL